MTYRQFKQAMKDGISFWWNDPAPIEGNDYTVTEIGWFTDEMALIRYNEGDSEAEVFLSELVETYFQPIPDEEIDGGELYDKDGMYLFSFWVYRTKQSAQEDFPRHKIVQYFADDVEGIEYID